MGCLSACCVLQSSLLSCCSHHCCRAIVITVVVLQPSLSSLLPAPPSPPRRLSERSRANACVPVSVCTYPRVSRGLGKAACIHCRHLEEHESERAARCVIYICLYMLINMCDIHSATVSCCELPVCMLCAAVITAVVL